MTETEINQTISNNLWTIRNNTYKLVQVKDKIKKKRLTQTEVGKAINVTFQQIQKFEKGVNNIGSAKLKILADYFDVPVGNMYEPITTYHKEIGEQNENVSNDSMGNQLFTYISNIYNNSVTHKLKGKHDRKQTRV